jgi:phosphoribosylglycinamide formyltransferase-1
MKKIGWFTTARGPGSFNLFTTVLKLIEEGRIDARLSFVFINRDVKGNEHRMKVIRMAEARGIPVIVLPSDTFMPDLKAKDMAAWRDAYGQELRARIAPYGMDFGVLAGYMLIVDPQTCRSHILINLHPALPDTYKGTWDEIVVKVAESGDASYGATVHLCSPVLDCGEPIAYDAFPVGDLRSGTAREELPQAIRAREARREVPLLMETIRLLVDGEVTVRDGELFDRQGRKLGGPFGLADRISSQLGEG